MLHDRLRRKVFAALVAVLLPAAAGASELRLMMVERIGCHWCAQWNAAIGPIYPKTAEGRAAPLLRHDIRHPVPDGIVVSAPPQFTPTFILLQDGTEIGRIEGYPGEDFFWGMLGQMLADASPHPPQQAAP